MTRHEEALGGPLLYVSHFRVMDATTNFTLTLPYSYNGTALVGSVWSLYNWATGKFEELQERTESKKATDVQIPAKFISAAKEVLLVARGHTPSSGSSGGCDATGAASLALVLFAPLALTVFRRQK